MKVITGERCLKVPTNDGAIDTSSEDKLVLQIEAATHDIVVVNVGFALGRNVSASHGIVFIFVTLVIGAQRCIHPKM